MKHFTPLLICLILCSGFKFDLKGPWIETRLRNVTLYTRPSGFSNTPSPDSADVDKILTTQAQAVERINNTLKTGFDNEVKIYLFNHDEAKTKIGTNSGGGAHVKICEMYFAFNKEFADKMDDFMGLHEMVHIAAGNELGYPATRLMSEGYANALSNVYKLHLTENGKIEGTSLEQWMTDFAKENKIMSPAKMLQEGDKVPEDLFYPQAGCFIKWLMDNYGVTITNAIYPLKSGKIIKALPELTGKDFVTIEKEYMKYIEKFK